MESLLGGLRVFLNMTHDNPLGSHRIGEQKEFVEAIFKYIFKVCVDEFCYCYLLLFILQVLVIIITCKLIKSRYIQWNL